MKRCFLYEKMLINSRYFLGLLKKIQKVVKPMRTSNSMAHMLFVGRKCNFLNMVPAANS